MFEWNKQMLKRKRFVSSDSTNSSQLNREAQIYEIIDKMQSHFCKLLSCFIRLMDQDINESQSYVNLHVSQPFEVQFPSDFTKREETKLMHSLYRRIMGLLTSVEGTNKLVQKLEQVFQWSKNEPNATMLEFFELYCCLIGKQIIALWRQKRKSIQKATLKLEHSEKQQKSQRKIKFKNISSQLCDSIYNVLDLQQVEACFLLIDGAKLKDNINYVYDLVKSRNKKTRKQVQSYASVRERRRESRNKVQEIKSLNLSRSASNEKIKRISLMKQNKERTLGISQSKQNNVRSLPPKTKIKLEPIDAKKAKLKLIR